MFSPDPTPISSTRPRAAPIVCRRYEPSWRFRIAQSLGSSCESLVFGFLTTYPVGWPHHRRGSNGVCDQRLLSWLL